MEERDTSAMVGDSISGEEQRIEQAAKCKAPEAYNLACTRRAHGLKSSTVMPGLSDQGRSSAWRGKCRQRVADRSASPLERQMAELEQDRRLRKSRQRVRARLIEYSTAPFSAHEEHQSKADNSLFAHYLSDLCRPIEEHSRRAGKMLVILAPRSGLRRA